MKISESNKKTWNSQAARYQAEASFSFDTVDFGDPRCLSDDDLRLIGPVQGKHVLELGCGGVNCGIALTKKGAVMKCTDISEAQLRFAKQNALTQNVNMTFLETPIENLSHFNNDRFGKVISICAFEYVKDIDAVLKKS